MGNYFHRQNSATQKPTGFLTSLHILVDIFKGFANLIMPTIEDQENAGVYLGGEGRD
jgi:hypothetical protein